MPLGGGTPTLLGPSYPDPAPIHPGGTQLRFAVSPDGTQVVYSVDAASLGFYELFSVPVAGGTSARLSPPLPDPLPPSFGPWVGSFQASPDGQHAVFTAYDTSSVASTLYVAPLPGGAAPLPLASGNSFRFAISPDSSRVAYSDFDVWGSSTSALRSVPLSGGAPADLATGGGELTFAFTADSERVVYHGEAFNGQPALLASVLAAGGQPPIPIATSDSGFGSGEVRFVLVPDGQSVFYTRPSTRAFSAARWRGVCDHAGPLTFAPGERAKSLPLTILDRAGFNGSRTIVLALDAPALAGTGLGGPTTITITIVDDEHGLFLPALRR